MTVFKKTTVPDPNDPVEKVIAAAWNALAKVNAPAEFGMNELMAIRQPMADVTLELQHLHGRQKKLLEWVRARMETLEGHGENTVEEGECRAFADVLEKMTGRPA